MSGKSRKQKQEEYLAAQKKKKKIMIISALSILLAIAIVAICVAVNLNKDKKKGDDSPENKAPSVTGAFAEKAISDIVSVQISTGETVYTVNNSYMPTIEGYESHVIDYTSLRSVLEISTKIPYTEKIEGVSGKLSEYGLDNSEKSILIKYTDETSAKILMGNRASDFEYYAMIENEDCVYKILAETFEAFMIHPSEYRRLDVCSIDGNNVNSITVEKNGVKEITVARDESFVSDNDYQIASFVVKYPYKNKTASLAPLGYIFNSMATVMADKIVEENPEDLSKYGLSAPSITFKAEDMVRTTTIKFGNEENGKVYLMCNDIPVVYQAQCELYELLKMYKAANYVEQFISLYSIDTVSSIEIKKGDKVRTMEIEKASTGEITYKTNGNVTSEKEFKNLYMLVAGLALDDVTEKKPSGEVYAEVTYKFNNSTTKTYKYYEYDADNCNVTAKNGLYCIVPKADFDAIV